MVNRRDLILGLPLLAAFGGAYALKPRKRLNLLDGKDLDAEIPTRFGQWEVTPSNAMILPKAPEGSLADQLYDQTVSRLYTSETELPVMLVIAYGGTQSDLLQLHRPEVCYRSVGFQIAHSEAVRLTLAPGVSLPARKLLATTNERVEPILYWSRIGDFLPTDGTEQRIMKLRNEMNGLIPDGVLVRLSTFSPPSEETYAALERFANLMLKSVQPSLRPALLGRPLADEMLKACNC